MNDTYHVYIDRNCDGTYEWQDDDDDNDGIADIKEICGANATFFSCMGGDPNVDDDLDGIPNYRESSFCFLNSKGVCASIDADGDGIINSLDLDADNDGIPDLVENRGVDSDGDGKVDGTWSDADNDGLHNTYDANYTGGDELTLKDSDGDGVPNVYDLDSDNDGLVDILEVGGVDVDKDGRVDNFTDTDNDGLAQSVDADQDNDGTIDNNAGVLVITGADTNGDGLTNSYSSGDFDADGVPNFLDKDCDNDGITDNIEVQSTANYVSSGSFNDSDGDGLDDDYEASGGTYLVPVNTDGDASVDFQEYDSDNDGKNDAIEAFDANGDGFATNDLITRRTAYVAMGGNTAYYPLIDADYNDIYDWQDTNSLGVLNFLNPASGYWHDSDGDGVVDLFDSNNYGDPVTPPNKDGAGDKDFRDINTIVALPVALVELSVTQEGAHNVIRWTTASELNNSHFMVQKSFNGQTFADIGRVEGNGNSTTRLNYSFPDADFRYPVLYYRLKQVDFNGTFQFSRTIKVIGAKMANSELTVIQPEGNGILTLILPDNGETRALNVRMYASSLQLVCEYQAEANVGSVSISTVDLLPGVYMLAITQNGQTTVKKVFIK